MPPSSAPIGPPIASPAAAPASLPQTDIAKLPQRTLLAAEHKDFWPWLHVDNHVDIHVAALRARTLTTRENWPGSRIWARPLRDPPEGAVRHARSGRWSR